MKKLTVSTNIIGTGHNFNRVSRTGTYRASPILWRLAFPSAVLWAAWSTSRMTGWPGRPGCPVAIYKNIYYIRITRGLDDTLHDNLPTGPTHGGIPRQSTVSEALPYSQSGFPPGPGREQILLRECIEMPQLEEQEDQVPQVNHWASNKMMRVYFNCWSFLRCDW